MSGGSVKGILSRLREGAELHRIASEREGHYWVLMPGADRVPDAVAEEVAIQACVVAVGAPVGRVSWKFEDRGVAEAREAIRQQELLKQAQEAELQGE